MNGTGADVRAPWRDPVLRAVAGPTLRPGGFALTDRAAELAGLAPGWPVLDVGAGTGATVARLRARHGARAVGLDAEPDPERRGPGAPPLVRAVAAALPVRPGSQRMVFCECVLSLTPDPGAALAQCALALAPGGVLALSDLYLPPGVPSAERGGSSCARGALGVREVLALVRAAGLATFLFEDHGPLLRQLAAQLVFAGGACWTGADGGCAPCGGRRGYYLLLARKGPGGM